MSTLTYDDWKAQVRATLKHHLDWDEYHLNQMEAIDWKAFYDDGLTPSEAVMEELLIEQTAA